MKKYLFFEVANVSIKKTSTLVSDELIKNGQCSEFFFIPNKFVNISLNFFKKLNSYKDQFKKRIDNVDVLIIQGYGFWEIFGLNYAKETNKKVVYIQHGLYSQKISRVNSSIFSNIFLSISKVSTLLFIVASIPNQSYIYKLKTSGCKILLIKIFCDFTSLSQIKVKSLSFVLMRL